MPFQHSPTLYLHSPQSGKNYEGAMARSRFSRMCKMSRELHDLVNPEDELPAWCQDFIATAHDRLASVYSYLEPRARESMGDVYLRGCDVIVGCWR